jgi:methylated-DNA-[protein]-cysteine S-methyltransferase
MVLQTLFRQVRFGEVVSYGELALRVGHPRASRAVGTAMATNPVPIVVPCHRVLRSGGNLGNYGGGIDMKRKLLTHEGALLA